MPNIYTLDIETKPDPLLIEVFNSGIKPAGNLKDPEKIKADIEKKKLAGRKSMSVDPDYCEIVCIGIKEVGTGDPGALYTIEEMEQWFTDRLNNDMKLVTFNGKSFDIPAIIKVGIRKGVRLPYAVLKGMTEKYKSSAHIDLSGVLSFGKTDFTSLDTYLRIYLGISKETLGDEFFATATDDELKKHCLEDLQYTEDLFMKFRYIV